MKWMWSMTLIAAGCAVLNAQDGKPSKMADTTKGLKKHDGKQVMVTGTLSHGMSDSMPNRRDTLALTSLKVVAPSCS